MVGHVCEWGSAVDAVASRALDVDHHPSGKAHHHQDGAADHDRDGHGDDASVSCETVVVAANTGFATVDPGIDAAVSPSVAAPLAIVRLASRPANLEEHAPRPPLFLLHASLLI